MTYKASCIAGAAALAMLAAPLSAAIYIKIPDLPGESQSATPGVEPDEIDLKAADSRSTIWGPGDAHLAYQVITLDNTQEGDEHEVEYDVASAASASSAGHEAAHVVQQRGGATEQAGDKDHDKWIDVLSWSTPQPVEKARVAERLRHRDRAVSSEAATRDAASGMASGKRQHKPLTVTKPIDKASPLKIPTRSGAGSITLKRGLADCTPGTRYPHILVGDDAVGREVTLEDVTVASCAREEVTFNYAKIKY